MVTDQPDTLVHRALGLYKALLHRAAKGEDLPDSDVGQWENVIDDIKSRNGTESLEQVFVTDTRNRGVKRANRHDDFKDRSRTSKRCRPTTTRYLPSPSPPPPSFGVTTKSTTSATSTTTIIPSTTTPTPAQDPVRLFFLTHLSNPYPTPTEKDKLCKKAKITRRKLESDLTNWRRRSDWTEIMNVYCAGDKGAMRRLVECVESGEEKDQGLLERFGRMRAYLEKRDEQPGEWVLKLSEMVESGRLDLLRSKQNANDSDSEDEDDQSEAGSYEDQDRDAEGESDEELQEVQFRFQPASIPTPSTASTKYGSDGLFTSVPLDIPTSTPVSESPLTELSPISSVGSHVAIVPTTHGGQLAPQGQQEVSGYSTPYIPRGASAKSSYSSLSAASNLALSEGSSRKRNISDSSTSTSLRSVSGSSSSSITQQTPNNNKRPAGKESFTRSSRSRVEDILSDHTQEASWVAGHQPQAQFHIGQDPRYMPQLSPHMSMDMSYGIPPPPYEMGGDMTPYLMPPPQTPSHGQGQLGWNVEGGFNFTPMPHKAHFEKGGHGVEGGVGGFEMPREYDFTFGVVGGSR